MLLYIVIIVLFVEEFPDEIVSQGEAALQIYLSSCSGGTAVTVFLRVDVVGRDGAGKTSLTKSLTLQEFDPDELSTRGVVIDPKCQIIVKEACDWTTPLTNEHYRDMYDKNVTAIVASKLDTPEVKDQYFRTKEEERPREKEQGQKRSHVSEGSTSASAKKTAIECTVRDSPLVDQIDDSSTDVRSETEQISTLSPEENYNVQQPDDQSVSVVKVYDNRSCDNDFQLTVPHFHRHRDRSSSPAGSLSNITAAQKPQSSLDAHRLAVSKSIASTDVMVDEKAVGDVGAKETGAESSVVRPHQSKHGATTTNTGPSAAAQQYGQQSQNGTKDERKRKMHATLPQGSKSAKISEAPPNEEPTRAIQSDQHFSQGTEAKTKRKRTTQAAAPLSEISQSIETMTDATVRVPENMKKRVSKFLRNKESLKKAQNELVATVLDYAGQHVFYATHHLCLSKAGFYYVVFDASQPLDGKTPSVFRVRKGEIVHIPLFDDETNLDRLLEWMSAIHVMEPDHAYRIRLFDEVGIASPAMFLVGTHSDKLRSQPGLLERQDKLIRKKLENNVLAKHIIWASRDEDRMCFYVDNTMTDPQSGTVDPQVCLLRQMTEEVARKVAQRHKLPVTWLKFEQEVRDVKILDETKKTVSVEELLHVAKKAAGIKSKEELEVLLHYLSNRAVLLYHPKALKSGEEEVVLDVEWLISQLEKVITIHTDVLPVFENDVTRSKEKGIMTASLINHLLSDSGFRQQLLMSLMKHFDLLCQYGGNDDSCLDKADDQHDYVSLKRTRTSSENRKDVECKAYFMPCLLQKRSVLQSSAVEGGCKTIALILKSDDVCVPKPLFYRLLTRFATRFPRLPQLFANVGYFHVYHGHKLEISLERYCVQMIVFTSIKECPLPAVCFLVREYVIDEVHKAKHPGMSGLKLKLGFYYPLTTDSVEGGQQQDFVSVEGYPAFRKHLYVASTDREIDPPSALKVWYPEFSEVKLMLK